jgi:hypothetical protein
LIKFNYIKTELQIQISKSQEEIRQNLLAHRNDHAESHAQILEGQRQLNDNVEEQKSKLTEAGNSAFVCASRMITNQIFRRSTSFESFDHCILGQRGYSRLVYARNEDLYPRGSSIMGG